MLRTRLWMGAALIALTVGVLAVDYRFAPWYPFLFALVLGLSIMACRELLNLLAASAKAVRALCYAAVVAMAVANWWPHMASVILGKGVSAWEQYPWQWIVSAFVVVVLAAFLVEMATFQAPGESVKRIALAIFVTAYLGLLPSFLAQLRWLPDPANANEGQSGSRATIALAMAIFVPKCCDIGAYFTGRWLGRHPMAPVLSPKKTWEGAAGGLTAAIAAALAFDLIGGLALFPGGLLVAAAFGLTVGTAGMLGDLAESLIKRDCQRKDASQGVPGFGGVLDVVDSIVFAAPVTYWWFRS
ncbi:MAG TPA: phosphatidate cytidylyltransferase [Gemmataceae bacterium]|jgi:phosphatidate cytidylyltransferase|nr:phosphatidate cytidylyltransferase [Gemmataceae bacterium]